MAATALHLIIIGDEILSGKRQDKHMAKVLEILDARGMELDSVRYLRDDRNAITRCLRWAREQAQAGAITFSTGGIGATTDDHTRQCAAQAFDQALQAHTEAQALIAQRITQSAPTRKDIHPDPYHADNEHIMNMGVLPAQAHIIPNPFNGMPGFYCSADNTAITPTSSQGGVFFFPGFPVMAWPMMEWVLDTRYDLSNTASARCEKSVILLEIAEAKLTPLMQQLETHHTDISAFSLPSVDTSRYGKTYVEFGIKGAEQAVEAAYAEMLQALQKMGVEVTDTLN